MSQNPNSQALRQQLSIGNIINVSLYLYRSHLKLYSKLALTAHLWLLVPIYGWAKFFAISALISRLAFDDLSSQQENISAAQTQINRQMWNFLITAILVIIISLLGAILVSFIGALLIVFLSYLVGYPLPKGNPSNLFFKDWLYTVIMLPLGISIYLSPLLFYSRLFITDLPLSIESKTSSIKAIKQSWTLTKNFRSRLIGIIIISFLLTLPILIVIWHGLSRVLAFISYNTLRYLITTQSIRAALVITALTLITGVIIMPFWQVTKAVVYYDFRSRKDGLDLTLRGRSI